jgi:hypothetical protein
VDDLGGSWEEDPFDHLQRSFLILHLLQFLQDSLSHSLGQILTDDVVEESSLLRQLTSLSEILRSGFDRT